MKKKKSKRLKKKHNKINYNWFKQNNVNLIALTDDSRL